MNNQLEIRDQLVMLSDSLQSVEDLVSFIMCSFKFQSKPKDSEERQEQLCINEDPNSDDNKDDMVSVLIADYSGTIHAFNPISPKMFHVEKDALRGKNFFQLMSSYSRKYCQETFGNNVFKSFKERKRTLRYSLPHMDDVDYDNFYVLTSKIELIQPKVGSPLKGEKFMIRISSRPTSSQSRKRLFKSYTDARTLLRHSYFHNQVYIQEVPQFVYPISYQTTTPGNRSAFDACPPRNKYDN